MSDRARGGIEIPVLQSERLHLRGHRPSDYEDCAAMWSDPAVVLYIGGKPATREEVWARMLRYVGHWAWMGYGIWVVEEKATGRFASEVGFSNHKREIQPPLMDRPELGWVLASSFHGKGYATEARRRGETNDSAISPQCASSTRRMCGPSGWRRSVDSKKSRAQPTKVRGRSNSRDSRRSEPREGTNLRKSE